MSIHDEKGEWATDDLAIGWQWADFNDVFEDHTSSEKKVKQGIYLPSGVVPIVDQGQVVIGGYTDDVSLAYDGPLPAIVFGDHTRCLKMVEHRFAQGADGVKVLVPTAVLVPQFAFRALTAIRLPDKGYSRHFKFLKASSFPVPPLREQKRIVAKIEELTARSRRAKEALDAVPPLLDQLRQSILAAAFRGDLTADWRAKNPDVEPADKLLARIRAERKRRWEAVRSGAGSSARGASQYQVPASVDDAHLPSLAQGWSWSTLEELSRAERPICYGVVQPGDIHANGVRLVRVCDLLGDGLAIDEASIRTISPEIDMDYARSRLEGGELLVSVVGTIGRTALAPPSMRGSNIARAIARVAFNLPWLAEWCAHWLNTSYMNDYLNRGSREVARKTLNIAQLVSVPIPLPSEPEAALLLETFRGTHARIRSALAELDSLRPHIENMDQSILAKAFRGELVPQDPTDEPASVLLDRIRAARTTEPPAKRPRKTKSPAPPEPKPAPTPIRVPTQPQLLLDPHTLQEQVVSALWPLGPLDKQTAIRKAAESLRTAGHVDFQRLRADGPLYTQILTAIRSAVKTGQLDRPTRGYVRACKPDALAYTPDDWRHALVASLGPEPIDREQAIRNAAQWAREQLGLEFSRLRADGHIAEGLRSAITSAIRRGEIIGHAKRISRPV